MGPKAQELPNSDTLASKILPSVGSIAILQPLHPYFSTVVVVNRVASYTCPQQCIEGPCRGPPTGHQSARIRTPLEAMESHVAQMLRAIPFISAGLLT